MLAMCSDGVSKLLDVEAVDIYSHFRCIQPLAPNYITPHAKLTYSHNWYMFMYIHVYFINF